MIDASKAQCIYCGKLLSIGSNKPGKQTVHGLKCPLEKCHKDIYTLYMRKMESRQQGPPPKSDSGRGIGGARRSELVTECMKKVSNKFTFDLLTFESGVRVILSGDFRFRPKMNVHFRFRLVNGISFSSAFSSTAENEKCFSVGL